MMPIIHTVATTLICQFCGRSIGHVDGTGSALAAAHFTRNGWTIVDGPISHESLGVQEVDQLVVCPLCQPILATVLGEINTSLREKLAAT